MTKPINVPSKYRLPLINIPSVHLDVRELGMSLADVFAADALAATQFSDLMPRAGLAPVLRVVAMDGNCWASVVGVSEVGGLVIEPDAAPASTPRRGRPPKVAEAA